MHSYRNIGYKVGRVDQAETALGAEMRLAADKKSKKAPAADKAKDKIVRRELNKVYTNGTLVDAELLTDEQAGHCVSIREDDSSETKDGKQNFGVCVLDSATSEFNLCAFEDDVCRTKLETLLRQLRPKEIVFTKVPHDCCAKLPFMADLVCTRAISPYQQRVFLRRFFLVTASGQACGRAKGSSFKRPSKNSKSSSLPMKTMTRWPTTLTVSARLFRSLSGGCSHTKSPLRRSVQ